MLVMITKGFEVNSREDVVALYSIEVGGKTYRFVRKDAKRIHAVRELFGLLDRIARRVPSWDSAGSDDSYVYRAGYVHLKKEEFAALTSAAEGLRAYQPEVHA